MLTIATENPSIGAFVIVVLLAITCNCASEDDGTGYYSVDSGGAGGSTAGSIGMGVTGGQEGVMAGSGGTGGQERLIAGSSGTGGQEGVIAGSSGSGDVAEGDGILLDGTCWPVCASDASDPDESGNVDGWGWEFNQSCIVVDSEPYNAGTPCDTEGPGQGGTVGQGGTGGIPTREGFCRPVFTSGVNVAWFNFSRDIPNPDIGRFTDLFNNIRSVGGTVVRWWFHTTGEVTPGYDDSGLALPVPQKHIDDLRSICDAARSVGVMMVISLWSFDMLQDYIDPSLRQKNLRLLTEDSARQTYIDNYLTPLVVALKGHKGIFAWEIFNEPEGMTPLGWTSEKVEMDVIQKNVNWMVDAIRSADPDVLVTNSAWTFISNANVGGYTNYYADDELIRVGGRPNGTLDFYQVHYYDNWGRDNSEVSPFAHDAPFWNLDKPITIGEFWVLELTHSGGYPPDDMYTILYNNSYSGAWSWQYANIDHGNIDGRWPKMQQSMQNLKEVAGADLECQ